jgi:hypothetical protein
MIFNQKRKIQVGEVTFLDHILPTYYGVIGLSRGAEDQGSYRIVQRASVIETIQLDREEICALANFQGSQVIPT